MTRLIPALLALCIALPAVAAPGPGECEIWLCLPVGFPAHIDECNKAKEEMVKRVWKGESPLPAFGECSVDGDSNGFTVNYGVAARIKDTNPTEYVYGRQCTVRDHNDAPASNTTNTDPPNCVGTYRFFQAYQHGQPVGDMIYIRKR